MKPLKVQPHTDHPGASDLLTVSGRHIALHEQARRLARHLHEHHTLELSSVQAQDLLARLYGRLSWADLSDGQEPDPGALTLEASARLRPILARRYGRTLGAWAAKRAVRAVLDGTNPQMSAGPRLYRLDAAANPDLREEQRRWLTGRCRIFADLSGLHADRNARLLLERLARLALGAPHAEELATFERLLWDHPGAGCRSLKRLIGQVSARIAATPAGTFPALGFWGENRAWSDPGAVLAWLMVRIHVRHGLSLLEWAGPGESLGLALIHDTAELPPLGVQPLHGLERVPELRQQRPPLKAAPDPAFGDLLGPAARLTQPLSDGLSIQRTGDRFTVWLDHGPTLSFDRDAALDLARTLETADVRPVELQQGRWRVTLHRPHSGSSLMVRWTNTAATTDGEASVPFPAFQAALSVQVELKPRWPGRAAPEQAVHARPA